MSRLTRSQLAKAILMWNNGKGTWQIAQSLERIRLHGNGAMKSNGEITEAIVANSLAAWREEKHQERKAS